MTEPEIRLPPLQVADLDPPAWLALLDDLEGAAEILGVVWKTAPTAYAIAPSSASLGADGRRAVADIRACLASASPLSVQLRYRFRGEIWRDTLMRLDVAAGTVRLVRIREADVGA